MAEVLDRPFRPVPKPGPKPKKRRPSESGWRQEVLTRDGFRCRLCGLVDRSGRSLSAHHLIFKSHCRPQYRTDARNGLTLCNEWGHGCHQKVHARRMPVRPEALPRSVIECLAEQGLTWDEEGEPQGPLSVYFGKGVRRWRDQAR